MIDWSMLPKELLLMIAIRLYSVLELLHFRSTCTSWRSSISVADDNPFPSRPLIHLNPLIATVVIKPPRKKQLYGLNYREFLSHTSFFRVSSSNQGWLIKCDTAGLTYGTFRCLLNPLSRLPLHHWCQNIDLTKFKVLEIQPAYTVQNWLKKNQDFGFKRLVLTGKHPLLGVCCDGKIRYWNGVIWTRIKDQVALFCDIIVQRGLAYALDSNGIVWWISSSLDIYRYGPSLDENITDDSCRDLTLVECCEEFYIVDRLLEDNLQKIKVRSVNRQSYPPSYKVIHDDVGITRCELSERNYYTKMVGFKVYKVDEELEKWVQVKSLGDNALVMATDTCFSVLTHEFNGCLPNSIYFSDEDEYEINVFKLDDGSIMTMSGYSQDCFQMFVPSFH
ncbi:hypothetical protein EUTSA_v10023184mg [Eutrema salsugineum]|uniref:KIB1-4 beta-propeller domain-containing protein n=1 Tax=Eutrema salsugineum TaxID=72664 RepID=V4MDZ1_EUTSA|nr:F-box protein At2g17690 [Eutrema salsugineum]ESQ50718.1 hypothetical protein EUTSA_v10023184mg [Eutrema salsugineum]